MRSIEMGRTLSLAARGVGRSPRGTRRGSHHSLVASHAQQPAPISDATAAISGRLDAATKPTLST